MIVYCAFVRCAARSHGRVNIIRDKEVWGGGEEIACTEKAREMIVYCAFVGCTASKSGRMRGKIEGQGRLYRKGMKMIVYCAFVGCAARSPGRVCIKGRGETKVEIEENQGLRGRWWFITRHSTSQGRLRTAHCQGQSTSAATSSCTSYCFPRTAVHH